jgi:hypothetical protein
LRIDIAVKLLVIDAMRKTVSASTGSPEATSRTPADPAWASSPSTTTPQAAPGTWAVLANSVNRRSTSANAVAIFALRPGSANCGGDVYDGDEKSDADDPYTHAWLLQATPRQPGRCYNVPASDSDSPIDDSRHRLSTRRLPTPD